MMPHPPLVAFHIFYQNRKRQTIDDLITGSNKTTWIKSTGNKLGKLADTIPGRVSGSGTIGYMKKSQIPRGKNVTYENMVCNYKPLKAEKCCVRLTIGGDCLVYNDETASPAASLLETKIMVNSTISNAKKGAWFMGIDIKDFFSTNTIATRKKRVFEGTF